MKTKDSISGDTNKTTNPSHPRSLSRRQFVLTGALYAILLDWPVGSAKIESLKEGVSLWFGRIRSVKMLGINQPLKWKQDVNSLTVQIPDKKPCDHAYVLKISG